MPDYLCFSVTLLTPRFHGRTEGSVSEWPPSPLRMLQALAAASAGRWNERSELSHAVPALRWLEALPPPRILAPRSKVSKAPYRLYVPDNVADKVAGAWCRGRDASIADYRTEKDVRPVHLDGDSVHYLYPLPQVDGDWKPFVGTLIQAARSITHFGWGIDPAVGNAKVMPAGELAELPGLCWLPDSSGGTPLRTPSSGSLDDLTRKHGDFLRRLHGGGFRPVPPLRVFRIVHYRREDQPPQRPYCVFELRETDGSWHRYPHRKLIHIAGMVRHLAIESMKKDPPRGVDPNWVESFVAGHAAGDSNSHRQLSYLPLPSIGHEHTDPSVRRVMIAAPVGDQAWLDHVARRLAGQLLRPEPDKPDPFDGEPPLLVPVKGDNVARFYTQASNEWHSVTPVILPGHDDKKPDKTRALIEKALRQSGIEQPCEFEWSAFSRFRKSYSAHKYGKDKQPQGYYRPTYLNSQTAVHLTIRFKDGLEVPGPIVIGAGRHCGLGLMANAP